MAIFFNQHVHELLENKKLIVIGDSIQRSVYKDLICLWTQQDSRYLSERELRAKGELSFLGDKLLHGGKLEGKMVNGVSYREVREFSDGKALFKYYFVTRSYSEHMTSILNELKTWQPDVIVMNSTFWDLHHYGDTDMQQYRENLAKLLNDINEIFSPSLLFIWNAALPLAERCKGGFLRKGFLTIPIDKIKTANKFAWMAATEQNKIYLDLFTELKDKNTFQQAEDGIHWGMRAHRKISNLILTEICKAWNRRIPEPPPQVVMRQYNRKSAAMPWSSFYPETENWGSSHTTSDYDDYEVEYYVPPAYWRLPSSYDRYQIPSPLFPNPTTNSWNNVSLSYNHPFANVSGRAREFQSFSPPVRYIFPTRYLPIENVDFKFSTPQGPYYPEKALFKPVIYSDPLPFRSFRSIRDSRQTLLPTPLGPPPFGIFNEGVGYRDRFKKLSNLRARRYKSSSCSSSTPVTSATQSRQSVSKVTPSNLLNNQHTEFLRQESDSKETTQNLSPNQSTNVSRRLSTEKETPQNSSTDQNDEVSVVNCTNSVDHNNNKEQKESVNESCPKAIAHSIDVGTKGCSDDTCKLPTQMHASLGGDSKNTIQLRGFLDKGAGVKRKREEDEESDSCKIPHEEGSDVYQGMKRKHEGEKAGDELFPVKCARQDDIPLVGENACENVERADSVALPEGCPMKETKENQAEEIDAHKPNSPEVCQAESIFHDVRCALTYDSFI